MDAFSIIPLVAKLSRHPEIGGTAGAFYIILLFIPMLFFAVVYAFFVKKEAVIDTEVQIARGAGNQTNWVVVPVMIFCIIVPIWTALYILGDCGVSFSRNKAIIYVPFARAIFINAFFSFGCCYLTSGVFIHLHNKLTGAYDVK